MTVLSTAITVLDWFGVIVFAITGALVASRKRMDLVGFALLGTVTGIGGGTLRDVFLGLSPVFWVREPVYLVTCVLVSCLVFFTAHIPESRYRALLWLDAVGLVSFAVTGGATAMLAGAGSIAAIAMGLISATFGGILRDVLGGESPIILRREIYVSAAFVAVSTFVLMGAVGISHEVTLVSGFTVGLLLRGAALYWNWSLPRYHPRPGHDPKDISCEPSSSTAWRYENARSSIVLRPVREAPRGGHPSMRETAVAPDVREVVVRGSATGFGQEIRIGPHRLAADEPAALGGTDTGPTPYDLLLAALGA
jgi:uncharacterized membrane protein YeiH